MRCNEDMLKEYGALCTAWVQAACTASSWNFNSGLVVGPLRPRVVPPYLSTRHRTPTTMSPEGNPEGRPMARVSQAAVMIARQSSSSLYPCFQPDGG